MLCYLISARLRLSLCHFLLSRSACLFILFQVLFYILFGRELETVFADSVLQNKNRSKVMV